MKSNSLRHASADNKKPGWNNAGVEDHWLVEDICPGADVQISEGVAGRSRCAVGREPHCHRDRRRGGGRRSGFHSRRRVQQGRAFARTRRAGPMDGFETRRDRDPGDPYQGEGTAGRCHGAKIVELAPGQPSVGRRGRYPGALFGDQYRARGPLRGGRPRSAAARSHAAAADQRAAIDGAGLYPAASCGNPLPSVVPGIVGSRDDH